MAVEATVYPFVEHDVAQRSPQWYQDRLGLLTGSVAHMVLATGRAKNEESTQRRNLRIRLALEIVTEHPVDDAITVTPAMQAGIDREPFARQAYEALTGTLVKETGFLSHRVHRAGCSPDGYLGNFDKILSIKCRQPSAHYEFLRWGTIPPQAIAQARHELWVTEADALDYLSWNPDFPEALQSRIVTIERRDADIPGYEAEALRFLAEVEAEVQQLYALVHQQTGGTHG